ncbi:uncharacterized protein [Choristoneura fumiferana]|uniref:uncharacterized protein n=2 Tax=Choristoneura fumiferana TaxID=7141 RepID=UPI003D153DC2
MASDQEEASLKSTTCELQPLINKRRFLKGRVTHISNLVNKAPIDELPFHNERLREILAKIEDVNMSIESLDPAEQEAGLQLETRCTELLLALQRRQATACAPDASTNTQSMHGTSKPSSGAGLLPKISLPTFGGNYNEWLNFKDLFSSLVHSNNDLNDVSKFYYLKSCLKREAAALVSTIDHSAANYSKAWDALMERYDNKVLIANHHIHSLLNLGKINRNYDLRNLMNDFQQHFNSLLALQVPELADMLLIHVLCSKLDFSSLRDFELSRKSKDFPSINDFIKHIQQRCQALEMISSESTKPTSSSHRSVSNVITNKESNGKQNKSGKLCGFCNGQHYINRCYKFLKLTVDDRIKFTDKFKLCSLCLSAGHSVSDCKQTFVCRSCQQKHHTLLHPKSVPVSPNNLIVSSSKNEAEPLADGVILSTPAIESSCLADSLVVPQPTLNLHNTAVEEKCEISLLPTALCYVIDDSGEIHFCRILLDSGSQKNYITEDFVAKLACKKTPVKFSVSGVGGNATPVNAKINLQISTRDFKHKFNSDFCVLKTITESLPTTNFPKNLMKWPGSVNLADPDFNVSRKVDAILGINDFRLCMQDGQLNLGPNIPGLLNTTFGWIFCGNLVLTRNQLIKMPDNSVCKFLQDDLTKFWTMEELPAQHIMSSADAACEQLYVQSVSRDSTGRYEVDLPVKEEMLPKLAYSMARPWWRVEVPAVEHRDLRHCACQLPRDQDAAPAGRG